MREKLNTIHADPKRGSDLAICTSKTITSILRHFDQDERESEAAQRQEWSTVKTKTEFYVVYVQFKGILEVFQSNQI